MNDRQFKDHSDRLRKQMGRDDYKKELAMADKKKAPLGQGSRFKAVEQAAKASGAKNPAAVAAAAGRKAHGQKAMTRYAQQGKRDAK